MATEGIEHYLFLAYVVRSVQSDTLHPTCYVSFEYVHEHYCVSLDDWHELPVLRDCDLHDLEVLHGCDLNDLKVLHDLAVLHDHSVYSSVSVHRAATCWLDPHHNEHHMYVGYLALLYNPENIQDRSILLHYFTKV